TRRPSDLKHFNKLDDTTRGWLVSRVLRGGVYEIAIEDLLKECKSEKEFVKKLVPTTIPFVKHSLRELCDRKKQRVELDMKGMVADLAEEYHAKHVGNKEYKDKIDELRGDFISNVKIGQLGTAELDYEKAMLELRGLYQKFHLLQYHHLRCYLLHRFQFRSEEHTSELQSRFDLVCRLLLEKK